MSLRCGCSLSYIKAYVRHRRLFYRMNLSKPQNVHTRTHFGHPFMTPMPETARTWQFGPEITLTVQKVLLLGVHVQVLSTKRHSFTRQWQCTCETVLSQLCRADMITQWVDEFRSWPRVFKFGVTRCNCACHAVNCIHHQWVRVIVVTKSLAAIAYLRDYNI